MDILFIFPQYIDSTKITEKQSNIEPTIDFTYELENNQF